MIVYKTNQLSSKNIVNVRVLLHHPLSKQILQATISQSAQYILLYSAIQFARTADSI